MGSIDVRRRSSSLLASGQDLLDRIIAPSTRQQAYDNVSSFSQEKPLLAVSSLPIAAQRAIFIDRIKKAFILIQTIFSALFIVMFLSFAISTIIFALGTAILFSVFWIGVALLLLLPTLFITVSLGILVWMWAVGSYLVARWAYAKIPVNVRGDMAVEMPNGKTMTVNKTGNGYGDVEARVDSPADVDVKNS